MKKITYFVMTSKIYLDRQKNVSETWGKNQDLFFYSDDDGKDEKTIKVTDKSDYWSLEEKHINIFKYLKNNFLDKEWFFFCDDDTFVNTKKLEEFVVGCDTKSAYGFLINCWPKMKDLFYHSGGGGVLLHRESLNVLCEKIHHKNTMFADVTLGLNLIECGIKMKTDEMFHSEPPLSYKIEMNQIKNNITFHHIKNFNEMFKLNSLCQ
jgi:hypothetical protein